MYDMASSAKGKLNEEHSDGSSKGQNHSDKLSPSSSAPLIGDGGGFNMLRTSRNGVCKQENNFLLQQNKYIIQTDAVSFNKIR